MSNYYVIGIDGGGTKTTAALADLSGKILKTGQSGSSSPRNVGVKAAARNVAEAIRKILPKKKIKITSVFVGLPAAQEEFAPKIGEIKKIISQKVKGNLTISSDQVVAFRSGTDKKDGIVLIAGTGCVAHGWRGKKEAKASGWGWLADEGSAFWVGQRVFQVVLKELDERGPKTTLTKLVFQLLKIKTKKDLLNIVYSTNPTRVLPPLSILCGKAAGRGDKVAEGIMKEAGRELERAVKAVIEKLNFKNKKFPLVLIGGMFNSKIVIDTVRNEIKRIAPKVYFIRPKDEPVVGAVKLALGQIK